MKSTQMEFTLVQGNGDYTGAFRHEAYVARITGVDKCYGDFERQPVEPTKVERERFGQPRIIETYTYVVTEPGLYEISECGLLKYMIAWHDDDGNLVYHNITEDRAQRIAMLLSQGVDLKTACTVK